MGKDGYKESQISNKAIQIKRGLDIPISGAPNNAVIECLYTTSVALLGDDYVDMKPSLQVNVGDFVKKGQVLFFDKNQPRIQYTSPVAGVVASINRGERRIFNSVVINTVADVGVFDVDATVDSKLEVEFARYLPEALPTLDQKIVEEQLLTSGLWQALRTRPFSKVADPAKPAAAIFINALDTNPLAAEPFEIIKADVPFFQAGIEIVKRLNSKVFVAIGVQAQYDDYLRDITDINVQRFVGSHPAGLVGTHIHFLYPASETRTLWTIDYQDVIAFGKLFLAGRLCAQKTIALAGPLVGKPRLLTVVHGSSLQEIVARNLTTYPARVISGSVLAGRGFIARDAHAVQDTQYCAYLGRYHLQVSVVSEGESRQFLHYLRFGLKRYSAARIYVSAFLPKQLFAMTSSTHGSERAMVPIGSYEKVMPLDILATQLLRALVVGDVDMAIKLGALELDEEDLGLCTFVCPSKYEFGPILRDNLNVILHGG